MEISQFHVYDHAVSDQSIREVAFYFGHPIGIEFYRRQALRWRGRKHVVRVYDHPWFKDKYEALKATTPNPAAEVK